MSNATGWLPFFYIWSGGSSNFYWIVYVGWTEDGYLEGGSNPTASGILNLWYLHSKITPQPKKHPHPILREQFLDPTPFPKTISDPIIE